MGSSDTPAGAFPTGVAGPGWAAAAPAHRPTTGRAAPARNTSRRDRYMPTPPSRRRRAPDGRSACSCGAGIGPTGRGQPPPGLTAGGPCGRPVVDLLYRHAPAITANAVNVTEPLACRPLGGPGRDRGRAPPRRRDRPRPAVRDAADQPSVRGAAGVAVSRVLPG